jgi:hypothetical protein
MHSKLFPTCQAGNNKLTGLFVGYLLSVES